MLGKAIATSFIILGIYIIFSFIANVGSKKGEEGAEQYHIGCYESSNPLEESLNIQLYLNNVSHQLSSHSVSRVLQIKAEIEASKVRTEAVNNIAVQFKKYITEYENIKSQNQYQQNFNRGLGKARDQYVKCREAFLKDQWNCDGTYSRYEATFVEFNNLKQKIRNLTLKTYDEQNKIEKILENGQQGDDTRTGVYHQTMKELHQNLTLFEDILKQTRDTINNTESQQKIYRMEKDSTLYSISQCKQYKSQIQYCQNISEKIKVIQFQRTANQIVDTIKLKRQLLLIYEKNLASAKKTGYDLYQWERRRQQTLQDLKILEDLERQNSGQFCNSQIFSKCTNERILQFEQNLMIIEKKLQQFEMVRLENERKVQTIGISIRNLQNKIKQLTDEYQNHLNSPQTMKGIEKSKRQQLNRIRQVINNLNKQLLDTKIDLKEIQNKRLRLRADLGSIMLRVGQLTDCLSKKDYFLKLKAKQPQHANQVEWKVNVNQKLVKAIGQAYQ